MTTGDSTLECDRTPSRSSIWIWRLSPVLAAVLALVSAMARQTGTPAFRTIWAEDGALFAQCAYSSASYLQCLMTSYDGWLHLLPRTLAEIAILAPPAYLALALNALSAVVAAASAYLTARAVRNASGSALAGGFAGAGLLLVAPAAREIGGNITNLHWITFVAAVSIIVATWLDHPFDRLDGILVGITALSSPFGLMLLVLAGFGLVLGRRRLAPISAFLAIATIIQLAANVVGKRNFLLDIPVTVLSPVDWYIRYVLHQGWFAQRGVVPDRFVAIATGVVVLILALRAGRALMRARANPRERPIDYRPLVELAAVLALLSAGAAVFWASTYLNRHVATRYLYTPSALMIVVLFLGAGLVARRSLGAWRPWPPNWPSPPRIAVVMLATVVGIGFATTFRLPNAASIGPNTMQETMALQPLCTAGASSVAIITSPLVIPATASPWMVEIPCDLIQS